MAVSSDHCTVRPLSTYLRPPCLVRHSVMISARFEAQVHSGMHSIRDKPVVVNGEIVIRPIMVVALTYDHRLLDGREATTFLGSFFSYLIRSMAS